MNIREVIFVLIVISIVGWPIFPYSHNWGWGFGGGLSGILVLVLILALLGII